MGISGGICDSNLAFRDLVTGMWWVWLSGEKAGLDDSDGGQKTSLLTGAIVEEVSRETQTKWLSRNTGDAAKPTSSDNQAQCLQKQTAVNVHLKSKQLLLFVLVRQYSLQCIVFMTEYNQIARGKPRGLRRM